MASLRTIFRKAETKGFQGDAGILLGPLKSQRGRKNPNFRIDWVVRQAVPMPSLDPVLIVETVSELVLKLHRDAIRKGERADGGGKQPIPLITKLKLQGKLRRLGVDVDKFPGRSGERFVPLTELEFAARKSPERGYRTGKFADTIRGTRIKVRSGSRTRARGFRAVTNVAGQNAIEARTSILPPASREYQSFVATEADRGVEYFYVEGKISKAVDRWLAKLWDAMVEGKVRPGKIRDMLAKEARLSL